MNLTLTKMIHNGEVRKKRKKLCYCHHITLQRSLKLPSCDTIHMWNFLMITYNFIYFLVSEKAINILGMK